MIRQENLLGIFLIFASIAGNVRAETDHPIEKKAAKKIEISFGNTKLFSARPAQSFTGELSNYIPTRAALFLIESLVRERWSVVAALNIPFSGDMKIEDGELISKIPSPIFCLGGRWSPFKYTMNTRAVVEGQIASLLGRSIGNQNGDIFFPTIGTRIHISKPNGFGMYIGTLFSFRRESLSLIYGVGNRF